MKFTLGGAPFILKLKKNYWGRKNTNNVQIKIPNESIFKYSYDNSTVVSVGTIQ